MPVKEVALDRDVRAMRLLPARAHIRGSHFLRRAAAVAALVAIDAGAFVLALLAESAAAGMAEWALWPGLSSAGLATSCLTVVVCNGVAGLYGRRHSRHRPARIFVTWTVAFVVASTLMLAVNRDGLGARLVAVWGLAFVIAIVGRWIFDLALALCYGVDGDAPRVLILGTPAACALAMPVLEALPAGERVCVAGCVLPGTTAAPSDAPSGLPPVVGSAADLSRALRTSEASQVIIADPVSLNGQLRQVMDACRDSRVPLKIVATSLPADGRAVGYIPGLDCPLFVVQPRPAGQASYEVKRAVDILVAGLLLVVLSPLLAAIALAVKLTSPGPAVFVDRRVGIGQRPFRFYKFRTMVAEAREAQAELEACNEADGILFKIRDDPRVTPTGRFLRRYSLDELPQLVNVLKGDMSIVGPRPLPMRDCDLMADWHRRRHVVLPGVTGLWQISGRSDLSSEEMIELDLRYIETWTLRSDAHIMWRTLGSVIGRHGAY
jgi:exopolysaccharide biosynthesis polyprenyl glycosylphosphotransferase